MLPITVTGIDLKFGEIDDVVTLRQDDGADFGTVSGLDIMGLIEGYIGGAIGYKPGVPFDRGEVAPLCECGDPLDADFYTGGSLFMWEPHQIIESVSMPGCSPSLAGTVMPADRLAYGKSDTVGDESSFKHSHLLAFPISKMLNLTSGRAACLGSGYVELDMLWMSEYDPTFNDDKLATFVVAPEMLATANAPAILSCSVDSIASNAGFPISQMFWCAGSWGTMGPMGGFNRPNADAPTIASVNAARTLYRQHRLGLAQAVYGNDTMCSPKLSFVMPKSQYKMQLVWPKSNANNTHYIGQSSMLWNWFKGDATNNDSVMLNFRYSDCCQKGFSR